ncbi:DUF1801 domain-containing protein [Streptomyces sp. NPDC097619]|uniref:iron chaperone n=1 Tax=Streptomyces sp. NPDC097619 TaxID=3157228 RepID=UPI003322B661
MDDSPEVDAYLAGFEPPVREVLERVRRAVRAGMPGGTEAVRYGMPAVMLDGRYGLHFAGWKQHVGLYPVPVFDGPLEEEVGPYRSGKDGVRLPYRPGVPYPLVTRIAEAITARRAAAG